jgi:hypothetical protein
MVEEGGAEAAGGDGGGVGWDETGRRGERESERRRTRRGRALISVAAARRSHGRVGPHRD